VQHPGAADDLELVAADADGPCERQRVRRDPLGMTGGVVVARIDGFGKGFERRAEMPLAIVVQLRGFERGGGVRREGGRELHVLGCESPARHELVRVERADGAGAASQRHADGRPHAGEHHAGRVLEPRVEPRIVRDQHIARVQGFAHRGAAREFGHGFVRALGPDGARLQLAGDRIDQQNRRPIRLENRLQPIEHAIEQRLQIVEGHQLAARCEQSMDRRRRDSGHRLGDRHADEGAVDLGLRRGRLDVVRGFHGVLQRAEPQQIADGEGGGRSLRPVHEDAVRAAQIFDRHDAFVGARETRVQARQARIVDLDVGLLRAADRLGVPRDEREWTRRRRFAYRTETDTRGHA
jgi:hypothetical protein